MTFLCRLRGVHRWSKFRAEWSFRYQVRTCRSCGARQVKDVITGRVGDIAR